MTSLPEYGVQTTAELAEEVKKYLTYFIPDITAIGDGDSGDEFANFLAAVIRNSHYNLDFRFREGNPNQVQLIENALELFQVND